MKDKIAEVILDVQESIEKEDDSIYLLQSHRRRIAQAIISLIVKELPKEKEYQHPCCVKGTCIRCAEIEGYNQCLKDIKHKLEVTDG